MTRAQALWLGFALVVVHNVEELLTMGAFFDAYRIRLPALLQSMTGERFVLSLAIVTLVVLLIFRAGARDRPRGTWLVLAVALQAVTGVNGLQHAGVSVWAGGYSPGVVTGLVLLLPYAIYLPARAVREEWVTVRQLVVTSSVLIVLALPFLMTLHAISSLFV